MATLAEIRAQYPQYGDLSDQQLADSMYRKFYSDMDRATFDQKIGLVAAPPDGLTPGSREYATWAMEQARAGNKLPTVGTHDAGWEERNLTSDGKGGVRVKQNSLGDKITAAAGSYIEGAPIIGPAWLDATTNIASWLRNDGTTAEDMKANLKNLQQDNPITSGAAGVGSSILNLAPLGMTQLGGRLLGTTGTVGQRLVAGGLSGAALSGADTAARGGDLGQIATNTAVGAGLGMVFPAVGGVKNYLANKAGKAAATTAAIKNAPAASELKSAASDLFKAVDQAGVTVNPNAFQQFVLDLATNAKKLRINDKLDPKAYATFQELGGILGEVKAGKVLTMSDLHTIRQIAQKAAISAEGRDAMFANKIVDGIDSFITKPGSTMTANGQATGKQLLEAVSTWGRAKRVGLVESAIERARNTASGFENGVRIEFRKLLNNKRTAGLFTATEREEMEKVVRGTTAANLAKLVGKFGFGPGANGLGGFLGGTAGFTFGGPVGAAAMAIGASGARKASEVLTERAAERAAKVVATPNIPAFVPKALPNGMIPPALLPLETTKKRQPVEITIGTRGL